MRGNLLAFGLVIAVLAVSAGAASASPAVQRAPWETDPGALENLSGHLDMYLKDQAIILDLRAQAGGTVDRQFTVKVGDSAGLLPNSFHSDAARVVVWTGHLVVIADREAQVFHFSVAGFDPPNLSSERHELPAFALAEAGPALTSGYKMTRIAGARAIHSYTASGAQSLMPHGIVPGSSFLMDCCATGDITCCTDYQNYGSGGGGSCQRSCSTTCQVTGSQCSTTCSTGTCAACSCNNGNPICYCF
jgi:hypothetical protein